ncbi:MAG TPA: hypothetical protein VGQ34_02265 [Sphingomicrobium sp.]|jgi:hypothetical protein|nr:hypothetical protein [Sphingomicrobium sp.]
MARTRLRPLLIALALLPAACDGAGDKDAGSSITVELPAAHPAIAEPGFSLEAPGRPSHPGHEQASQVLQELAATRS